MKTPAVLVVAATVTMLGAGCAEPTSTSAGAALDRAAVAAALSSVPIGYGDLSSSYVGTTMMAGGNAGLWVGGGREAGFAQGAMMGGGLHDAFAGGVGFAGRGGHHGPFGGGLGCSGTFDAATGRVVCTDVVVGGLTFQRSARYTTAAGVVQQAFDTVTTNTVNIRSSVTGTLSFTRDSSQGGMGGQVGQGGHHGGGGGMMGGWGMGRGHGGRLLGDTATILSAATVISSASDRTTTGLAAGSTQRTVEGASRGTETTTGTSSRGSFTATRIVGDTTRGLVVPVRTDGVPPYPTAGTVTRGMSVTLQYQGASPTTVSRREVVTYDGTATAKVVITENGSTRTCTRPLPRGPLSCS